MKALLIAALIAGLTTGCTTARAPQRKDTFSSFDHPSRKEGEKLIEPGMINFLDTDLGQILAFYQDLSKRTVVRSPQVPRNAKISLRNNTALSAVEVLRLLDTVLAQHGIVMAYSGDDVVKAIPATTASTEAGPVIDLPAEQLPDSKSFMIRHVTLKNVKADEIVSLIQPFASLPNSIVAGKGSNIIYLRDYSSNIREMLRVIGEAENGRGAIRKK